MTNPDEDEQDRWGLLGSIAVLVGAVILHHEGVAFSARIFLLGLVVGACVVWLAERVHAARDRRLAFLLVVLASPWLGWAASRWFGPAVGAGLVGLGIGVVVLGLTRRFDRKVLADGLLGE